MKQRLILDVVARQKGLAQTEKSMKKLSSSVQRMKGLSFNKLDKEYIRLNQSLNKQNIELKRARFNTTALGQAWENSKQGVLGFNGALLSTLFLGMEMKRVFTGALKSMFESYKKIIGEGNEFNRLTTKLSANWEFFKFQLADALFQSKFFRTMVENAISFLKVLQSMPEPMKQFAGWGLVAGAALGAIFLYIGIIGLGLAGLIDGAASLGLGFKGANTNAKGLKKTIDGITPNGKYVYDFKLKGKFPDGSKFNMKDFSVKINNKLKTYFDDIANKLDDIKIKPMEDFSTKAGNNLAAGKSSTSGISKTLDKVKNLLNKIIPTRVLNFLKSSAKILSKFAIWIDVLISIFQVWDEVMEREYRTTTLKVSALLTTAGIKFVENITRFVNFVVTGVFDMITGFLSDLLKTFGLGDNFLTDVLDIDFSKEIDKLLEKTGKNIRSSMLNIFSEDKVYGNGLEPYKPGKLDLNDSLNVYSAGGGTTTSNVNNEYNIIIDGNTVSSENDSIKQVVDTLLRESLLEQGFNINMTSGR